jgi:hypothetical protein
MDRSAHVFTRQTENRMPYGGTNDFARPGDDLIAEIHGLVAFQRFVKALIL